MLALFLSSLLEILVLYSMYYGFFTPNIKRKKQQCYHISVCKTSQKN